MPTADLDLEFFDAIYFKAFSSQAANLAGQATRRIQNCGDSIKMLIDRPELPAAYRKDCCNFLEIAAAHQVAVQKVCSDVAAFGHVCWWDDAPKVRRRASPDAHALEARKRLLEAFTRA
ncbi:MAG: hypothetical protein ABI212_14590 [Burkholderiaceae bacterium]